MKFITLRRGGLHSNRPKPLKKFGKASRTPLASLKRVFLGAGFAVLLSALPMCGGESPGQGNSDAGRNICPTEYKCENDVVFRCEESGNRINWAIEEDCGALGQTCTSESPECTPKNPKRQSISFICETTEVKFDCDNVGKGWDYSRGSCGPTDGVCTCYQYYGCGTHEPWCAPYGCGANWPSCAERENYGFCSVQNLCEGDSHSSPLLEPGGWIKVPFRNLRSPLDALKITVLGKRLLARDFSNFVEVQVDDLPPRRVPIWSRVICEPISVFFYWSDLTGGGTQDNVSDDEEVTVTLRGINDCTAVWLSGITATFWYPETTIE